MNKTLSAGLILMILLMTLSLLANVIAPYGPTETDKLRKTENGYYSSPFQPDQIHYFGTDEYGFDIFSILLYGSRYTLIFCVTTALARVVFGTLTALAAGARKSRFISIFQVFSALPSMILVYFVLVSISFNAPLPPLRLAFYQSLVIVLVGVPGSFTAIHGRVLEIRGAEHVEAARLCGAGGVYLIRKHILPFLAEPLLLAFSREMISVLVLIGQLGIFNTFIGGTIIQNDPPIYLTRSFEWAGFLGLNRHYIFSSYEWMLLFPLAAYFLLLVSLYLCSHGLENFFHHKYRRTPLV
jgi:peptide/nickel transport system permease protein